MNRNTPTRNPLRTAHQRAARLLPAVLVCAFAFTTASAERGGHHAAFQATRSQAPAPIERKPPPAPHPQSGNAATPGRLGTNHQHLSEWMQSHSNLTLDQQQHALEAEPGFRQLQPDVQQRMHDRLAQLNAMNPQQRQHALANTEAMERLSPPQRQQVRSALGDLGALPEDRRRFVARTFRALRDMPDAQRQAYLNSPQFRSQFSDHERATLNNLFTVAPYLPPPPPPAGPQAPR